MTQGIDKKSCTRRGVVLHRRNPFMPEIKPKTRRITNKRGDMMLVSPETGEIKATVAGFWEAEEVDSTKFLKLFVNGVKALAELSNAGTRIFELLYIEMQNNVGRDQVYLSYTALDERQSSISRSTFSRGISELIDKKFIAAMPAVGWYWVNPDYMWNGDRLAFVKEYRRTPPNKKQHQRGLFDDSGASNLEPETQAQLTEVVDQLNAAAATRGATGRWTADSGGDEPTA